MRNRKILDIVIRSLNEQAADPKQAFWACGLARETAQAIRAAGRMDELNEYARRMVDHYLEGA